MVTSEKRRSSRMMVIKLNCDLSHDSFLHPVFPSRPPTCMNQAACLTLYGDTVCVLLKLEPVFTVGQ